MFFASIFVFLHREFYLYCEWFYFVGTEIYEWSITFFPYNQRVIYLIPKKYITNVFFFHLMMKENNIFVEIAAFS